jgi:hypothetical protein
MEREALLLSTRKLGNNLGTISAEYLPVFTSTDQREPRRISNIDNPGYLDTVEVSGSIPVAPIGSIRYCYLEMTIRFKGK